MLTTRVLFTVHQLSLTIVYHDEVLVADVTATIIEMVTMVDGR